MSDPTEIVRQTNVRLKGALAACAHLRGKNAFLDHALDAGDRVSIPEETRLVGYAKQEKEFLVFLKTIEPHLPTTPSLGPRSQGTLELRTEGGGTWQVLFWYRATPKIVVHKVAWVGVPLGAIKPLRAPKGATKSTGAPATKTIAGTRFVDASGDFVIARVAGSRLVIVRGAAGSAGRKSGKTFDHVWKANAAFEKLAASLRKQGFRRARA